MDLRYSRYPPEFKRRNNPGSSSDRPKSLHLDGHLSTWFQLEVTPHVHELPARKRRSPYFSRDRKNFSLSPACVWQVRSTPQAPCCLRRAFRLYKPDPVSPDLEGVGDWFFRHHGIMVMTFPCKYKALWLLILWLAIARASEHLIQTSPSIWPRCRWNRNTNC